MDCVHKQLWITIYLVLKFKSIFLNILSLSLPLEGTAPPQTRQDIILKDGGLFYIYDRNNEHSVNVGMN